MNYFKFKYQLLNEYPWIIVLSTASFTVLFLDFFCTPEVCEINCLMLSFNTLASKVRNNLGYLAASVVSGHILNRNYSFQFWGYGKAGWDPENYSPEAQVLFLELKNALLAKDKKEIYNILYAILTNQQGIFTKSYGKVFRNADTLIAAFNKENPGDSINEKEYLQQHNYSYDESELFFLDPTNRGTVLTNIQEILAPKIVMNKNSSILVERSIELKDKINLSDQKNPEYSVGVFTSDKGKTNVVVYDSDLKTTDEDSLYLKMLNLTNSNELNVVKLDSKNSLGINIFVVALKNKDSKNVIINSEAQRALIIEILINKAKEYPKIFYNFSPQSDVVKEFMLTGDTKYLNQMKSPVFRFIIPQDFKDLMHNDKIFYESKTFKTIVSLNERGRFSYEEHSEVDDIG